MDDKDLQGIVVLAKREKWVEEEWGYCRSLLGLVWEDNINCCKSARRIDFQAHIYSNKELNLSRWDLWHIHNKV